MKREIILVLDNIRSRENVGSIFRTADAAGVSKIYLCGITPRPPHPKISKTALGAEQYIPWEYKKQTSRILQELKKNGYQIVALEQTKKSSDIFKFKFPKSKKIAFVLGNEVRGLSGPVLKHCDKAVEIPMYGKKESLNVSVAAGIALFAIRQGS